MFLVLSLLGTAWASSDPGVLRKVHNQTHCTASVWNQEPGSCFSSLGGQPTTFCREGDSGCSTGQRVASKLRIETVGLDCREYTWYWTCASHYKSKCGAYWCDVRSTCINDTVCVCEEPLHGDPVFQSCICDINTYYNGSDCIPVTECTQTECPVTEECTKTVPWWETGWAWGILTGVAMTGIILSLLYYKTHKIKVRATRDRTDTVVHSSMQNPLYATQPLPHVDMDGYAHITSSTA